MTQEQIDQSPQANLHFMQALGYYYAGMPEQATTEFLKTLAIDPAHAEAAVARAVGDPVAKTDAARDHVRALEVGHVEAIDHLGRLFEIEELARPLGRLLADRLEKLVEVARQQLGRVATLRNIGVALVEDAEELLENRADPCACFALAHPTLL